MCGSIFFDNGCRLVKTVLAILGTIIEHGTTLKSRESSFNSKRAYVFTIN